MKSAIRAVMRLNCNAAITLILTGSFLLASAAAPQVTLSEDASTYTIENGIVSARTAKRSGDLLSLKFRGLEMLDASAGRSGGYWSHNTARGRTSWSITIDPKTNGGERAEFSLKGVYDGAPLGNGPGGSVVADIEIRYALGRGDSGIYTYSILEHKTNYPATSLGEARFCAKLSDRLFDWMTVDAARNMRMITAFDWNHGTLMNMKEARRMTTGACVGQVEHKYDYSANQFETRTWGWSSTEKQVGVWFINPSVEYLSGGPTKVELSAHRDATFGTNTNAPAPPTLLNYWRSSHYGGSVCSIAANEAWTKVVGPFLIYCNTGVTPALMWQDALAKGTNEAAAWPYEWVAGVDFPRRGDRATVSGHLLLRDSQAPGLKLSRLLVGLTAPNYALPRGNRGSGGFSSGAARLVNWQMDARNYQFWELGESDGSFRIPNVRPGTYALHAIADGVLGEFVATNVVVSAGQKLDLGEMKWQPVRYGKTLWEIGIPNRSGIEFFKGAEHARWGWYLDYPKLFPHDVNYVIGKSDFRRDWFFEQVPHNENPENTTGTGNGRGTTWSVTFPLAEAPHGKATLRLAICGTGTRTLAVSLNDHGIGSLTNLVYDATINRDGVAGYWSEHDLAFDATIMKQGENVLKLTVPAGGLTSGIIYDYLRLEQDEAAQPAVK
jgi:rhamnogalacturonan endolyase